MIRSHASTESDGQAAWRGLPKVSTAIGKRPGLAAGAEAGLGVRGANVAPQSAAGAFRRNYCTEPASRFDWDHFARNAHERVPVGWSRFKRKSISVTDRYTYRGKVLTVV